MITLNLDKKCFSPTLFPLLLDYSKRWMVFCGSAGSGKSYFIAQKLIVRACAEPIKILVCRNTANSLRNSCFSLFKEILTKWKLISYVKVKETDMSITFPNGSTIIFMGLDDEHKLLSLNNISTIWIEEAFEVKRDIVEQLNLRMRGNANNQQIILSFNPISAHHWLKDFVDNPPASFQYSHTTYLDNPFLSKEYVDSLEELKTRNPAKARVFCYGEWGVDAEGLVLTNWRAEEFDVMELAKTLEHRAGMDVGWVDKTAIINSLYDKENRTIYVFEEFYKSGVLLTEMVDAINSLSIGKTRLMVDSAEPRTIQALRKEGINAVACSKGKDSVKAGIMFLQDNTLIIHPTCKNLIMELENFSYIKSRQTGEYTEETTHEFSHAIDGLRYAYSDIYTNKKLNSLSKMSLGI